MPNSPQRVDVGRESVRDTVKRLSQGTHPAKPDMQLPELDPESEKTIVGVFARMKSIYGHLWSSNWQSEAQLKIAQAEWLDAFKRSGLSRADVGAALNYLSDKPRILDDGRTWMPTLPEFIQLARQQAYRRRREREQAQRFASSVLPESDEQRERRLQRESEERRRFREIAQTGIQDLKTIMSAD
ncbi:MAG: hypothetical protein AAGI24_04205 [Pseudomonadota bacterium]